MAKQAKTIFITGAHGFIGAAVQRNASASPKCRVKIVPRESDNHRVNEILTSHSGPGAIIHLAWPQLSNAGSLAGAKRENDEAAWLRFVDETEHLRLAAQKAGIEFIGIGSGLENHANDGVIEIGEPYKTYVQRKHQLRTILKNCSKSDFSWLRLHFIFGPGESAERIVPAAIRASLSGAPFRCGAPHRRRRWMHIDDLAQALIAFAIAPQPGQWDIAGGEALTFNALFNLIESATGAPLILTGGELRPADAALAEILAKNLAPIVPETIGTQENLRARLNSYVDWIQNADSNKVNGHS